MRKELLFALFGGVLLGSIIAYGIWRANSAMVSNPLTSTQTKPKEISKDTEDKPISLIKPEEFSVALDSVATISGVTSANSWLVISGEDDDFIIKTESDGSFTTDIDLVAGLNEIVAKVFTNDNEYEISVPVAYSSQFSAQIESEFTDKKETDDENSPDESNSPTPTKSNAVISDLPDDNANAIRKAVQEKLEAAKKKITSYVGSVTDISDTTIEINSDTKGIQQIATDESSIFVSFGESNKVVKSEDLALGDMIIAMGFKNGSEVLEAKRILISSSDTLSVKRKFVKGIVVSSTAKELTIKTKDTEESFSPIGSVPTYTLKSDEIVKTKYSALSEGDEVIVVAYADENGDFWARLIQVTKVADEPN